MTYAQAQPRPEAFLRFDASQNSYYIAVTTDPKIKSGVDITKVVTAEVYREGQLLSGIRIGPTDNLGSDFTVQLSDQSIFQGSFKPLTLAVSSYPTDAGPRGFMLGVGTEFKTELVANAPSCERRLAVVISGEESTKDPLEATDPQEQQAITRRNNYLLQRARQVLPAYLNNNIPQARVDARTAPSVEPRQVQSIKVIPNPAPDAASVIVCLNLQPDMPNGIYDLEVRYPNNAPVELARPLLKTNLVSLGHKIPDPTSLPPNNGKRPLEDNLDLSVQFASSVRDVERNGVTTRERDNKWKVGLRLAPLLNLLPEPDIGKKNFYFLTPFFVDARVSNGKITKDTLSLNRVYIGSEFELRHYTNPSTYPTYQRYVIRALNASDRDFKQSEWSINFEMQPVFSRLNRPLRWDIKTRRPVLNQNPNAAPFIIPNRTGFGYQVLPLLGVQVGHTYRNRRPFAAIEQTRSVRRAYFGGTINLDLTSFARLTLTDIFYIRGEKANDRGHNYFNGRLELPLPAFSRDSAQSFFMAFERGGQPPFATPDVNAFTFGFRIQWAGWFSKFR
jgi:hypothetical protein